MAKVGGLFFELSANVARLQSDLNRATSMLDKFAKGASRAFAGLGVGLAGGAVISFLQDCTREADEAEVAMTRLRTTLVSLGNVGNVQETSDAVKTLSKHLEQVSGYEDDAIQNIAQRGLLMGVGTRDIELYTEAVVNLARALGVDLDKAAEMVLRGLGGQSKGFNAVNREIKELIDSGADAVTIMKKINETMGPQAEEYMKTHEGRLKALNLQYKELKESIGNAWKELMVFLFMGQRGMKPEDMPLDLQGFGPEQVGEKVNKELEKARQVLGAGSKTNIPKAKKEPTGGPNLDRFFKESLDYEEAVARKLYTIRQAELAATQQIALAEAEIAVKMGKLTEADFIRLQTKQKIEELDQRYLAISAQIENADLAKRQELEAQLHVIIQQQDAIKRTGDLHAQYAQYMVSDAKKAEDAFKRAFQSAEDAFVDFCTTGEFSFRNMLQGMLRELNKFMIQMMANSVNKSLGGSGIGGLGGLFGSLFGGGGGGFLGGLAGSMDAGFFQDLGIGGMGIGFAKGGVIHRPTVFPMSGGMGLMGEAGPEAVLPLQRDASGNLGVAGGGDGGGTPVVINISAMDPASFLDVITRNKSSLETVISKSLKGNSMLRNTIRATR